MNKLLPIRVYEFLITRKCNLNCTYCFEKDKSGTQNIDLEKVYSLLFNDENFLSFPNSEFYMFGGEPLLNIDSLDQLAQKIQSSNILSEKQKEKYIKSLFSGIITNGTLINRTIDILKKYNASLQISLDGPEDINDLYRVDFNNKGHFKEIMNNIKLCQENNIKYSIHGALCNKSYKNFSQIVKWFLEVQLENPREKNISEFLFRNFLQIVFEDNVSDEDINILLNQYEEAIKIILYSDVLENYTMKDRKDCACGFLVRHGGVCSAANIMFAFDNDMYIYPCHRLMTSGREKTIHEHSLGQIGSSTSWNYKLYEQFLDLSNRGILYGSVYNYIPRDSTRPQFMANWCPSTNFECTGNVNTYPCKHNILLAELQCFIPRLAEHYELNIYEYMKKHKR